MFIDMRQCCGTIFMTIFILKNYHINFNSALQIRAGQQPINAILLALTIHHTYHDVMIIVTGGFSKNIF